MTVTRTAQPVIVKSKRTKPLRISHKVKDRIEQGTTVPQSPTKTSASIPTTGEPAVLISKQKGLTREDIKPTTVDSMVSSSATAVGQMKQV